TDFIDCNLAEVQSDDARISPTTKWPIGIELTNLETMRDEQMDLDNFPYQILYFPTYRLVEENLYNIGYKKTNVNFQSKQIIHFEMEDIHRQWNRITQDMKNIFIEEFTQINGRMLDELSVEINRNLIHYDKLLDKEKLILTLSRSGDNVAEASRTRILELVNSSEIINSKYEPLAYFLSNLITIYESQKDKDDAIHTFVNIVNGYLRDKEVFYNAKELSLQVVRKADGQPIRLERLSSGEKQIISIFTRLLLDFEQTRPFAVFFDEPELSLSVEWQEKLLTDIVEKTNTQFLLAATHSPFIYDNGLLQYGDVLDITYRNGQVAHV
ncbi:MAG: AAA family ATPase, partial [Chloroflexota bacterium]